MIPALGHLLIKKLKAKRGGGGIHLQCIGKEGLDSKNMSSAESFLTMGTRVFY